MPLGDRKNMVYAGSTVVYGRGTAVITGTGMNTEIGKIADALTLAEKKLTPLQIKLAKLSKVLTYLVLGIAALVFLLGVLRAGKLTAEVTLNSFMIAVSLAVAAIRGISRCCYGGTVYRCYKHGKRNAISAHSCGNLGTQIICSDKTGTHTE